MTLRYLVDTDWIIHYLNGNRAVVSRLNTLSDQGCAVSVVSLAELYEGVYFSSKEICAQMLLSENTVKSYVQDLLQKMGARNRVDAAMIASKRGWI